MEESGLKIVNTHNNEVVLEATTIPSIPSNSHQISSNNLQINTHIFSDILKGFISVPNRTIKIVFDSKIQKGLDNGKYTLMKSENGKTFADAVNKNGKIVGKGKIVESGQLRQIVSSIFQITSIAVAQSHLDDINKNLKEIKDILYDIQNYLEATEQAKIEGSIKYLKQIAVNIENLKPSDSLSPAKKNQIETINKEFLELESKLFNDFDNLIKKIDNQKDEDWFGTGDTYEILRKLTKDDLKPLIKRYRLLSQLSTLISYIHTYIDPLGIEFTHVKMDYRKWNEIFLNYYKKTEKKSNSLLRDSWFNTSDTLRDRRENIILSSKDNITELNNQLKEYQERENIIIERVHNILNNKKISLALSFNDNGEISKTAVIKQ